MGFKFQIYLNYQIMNKFVYSSQQNFDLKKMNEKILIFSSLALCFYPELSGVGELDDGVVGVSGVEHALLPQHLHHILWESRCVHVAISGGVVVQKVLGRLRRCAWRRRVIFFLQ